MGGTWICKKKKIKLKKEKKYCISNALNHTQSAIIVNSSNAHLWDSASDEPLPIQVEDKEAVQGSSTRFHIRARCSVLVLAW